jgi:SGNH hydrolase-like domain, acetyltransferase AlgX
MPHLFDRVRSVFPVESGRRILPTLNLILLTATYAALFTEAQPSRSFRAATIAGGVFVLCAAWLTLKTHARRRWLAAPHAAGARVALAVVPWLGLAALVAARGLWWTQRSMALRAFALYALANWSFAWLLEPGPPREDGWFTAPRRACAILAVVLIALGVQGAAFGFTTFGCVVSLAIAAAASLVLSVGRFGSRAACLKVFVASAATFIGVALTEGAVRLLHVGQNLQESDSRTYARRFYSLTPPRAVFVNPPKALDEFPPALIEINGSGIRGPELSGPTDVLLIGDSMIEARQLPWDQTLGPRLQQALRTRGLPQRVVAHGMRGWSPLLEWNWYLKVGRGLHPRAVLLFFFWNDLWPAGDEATTFRATLQADGRPDYFEVPVDPTWLWYKHVRALRVAGSAWQSLTFSGMKHAFTTARSRTGAAGTLDDAAADRLARSVTEPPLSADQIAALVTKPDDQLDPSLRQLTSGSFWASFRPVPLWAATQRRAAATTELELTRFAADVAADGARLTIVYVPNPLQIGPRECAVGRLFDRVDTGVVLPPESGIQTWLRGVAQHAGFDVLDASDAMRAFERSRAPGDSAPLYLRADCHWSARGHQFMADYLADRLAHAPVPEPISQ